MWRVHKIIFSDENRVETEQNIPGVSFVNICQKRLVEFLNSDYTEEK